MFKKVTPRNVGDHVPGKGYLLHCQWQGCEKPGQLFWGSRPDARFCCDKCRFRYHNDIHKEERKAARKGLRMMQINDRILAKLYAIYGSKPLPKELLRSHGYFTEPPCTRIRSEFSGREGHLFFNYVYSPVKGKETFQIFQKKNYDKV
jgi:hypothetical protein